ncbi:MAG: DUF4321 domain-containing protein [Candidatus Omnitrophica bacterium]|nr:DUF4321 domain-containing protein [Candidatus Omnitrophota bacterium]
MRFLYTVIILFLCAMIGTCIGEILLFFIPEKWYFYNLISKSLNPTWKINSLDLIIFNLSFSLIFKINLFTLVGLIIGAVYTLRKI